MHPSATVNFCVNIQEERQSAFYGNSPSYVKCIDGKILTSAHPTVKSKTFPLCCIFNSTKAILKFGRDMKLNSFFSHFKVRNFCLVNDYEFSLKHFVEIGSALSANSHTEECEPLKTYFISESNFAKLKNTNCTLAKNSYLEAVKYLINKK